MSLALSQSSSSDERAPAKMINACHFTAGAGVNKEDLNDSVSRSRTAAVQAVQAAMAARESASELKATLIDELNNSQKREEALRRVISRQESSVAQKSSDYHALASQALATSSKLEKRLSDSEAARAALASELAEARDAIATLQDRLLFLTNKTQGTLQSTISGPLPGLAPGPAHCRRCVEYSERCQAYEAKIAELEQELRGARLKLDQRTAAAKLSLDELAASLAAQKRLEAQIRALRAVQTDEVSDLVRRLEGREQEVVALSLQLKDSNEELLAVHDQQEAVSKIEASGLRPADLRTIEERGEVIYDPKAHEVVMELAESLSEAQGKAEHKERENVFLKSKIVELQSETNDLKVAIQTDHEEQMDKADDINILREENEVLVTRLAKAEGVAVQLKKLLHGLADVCNTAGNRIARAIENGGDGDEDTDADESMRLNMGLNVTVGEAHVGLRR